MKFDRSYKFDLCYYGQVNSLRLKLSVASKWAHKQIGDLLITKGVNESAIFFFVTMKVKYSKTIIFQKGNEIIFNSIFFYNFDHYKIK